MDKLLNIEAEHFLILSAIIFAISIAGVFMNKNIINILMCLEMSLISITINFNCFSVVLGDLSGQIFSIFMLVVGAAEAAIGLAILAVIYRQRDSVYIDDIKDNSL